MSRALTSLIAFALWLSTWADAHAQAIELDHPRQCGPLICYPQHGEPGRYYYIASSLRVARRGAEAM